MAAVPTKIASCASSRVINLASAKISRGCGSESVGGRPATYISGCDRENARRGGQWCARQQMIISGRHCASLAEHFVINWGEMAAYSVRNEAYGVEARLRACPGPAMSPLVNASPAMARHIVLCQRLYIERVWRVRSLARLRAYHLCGVVDTTSMPSALVAKSGGTVKNMVTALDRQLRRSAR